MQKWQQTPEQLGLAYQSVHHKSADGTPLLSWWLPAEAAEATVLFLQGNAENISTHINSVASMVPNKINLFLLGYRGFGASEGSPQLPALLEDIASAATWIRENQPTTPLIVLGQSMGAALAVNFVARAGTDHKVQAVIVEACFTSFPGIATHALSHSLITWPLVPVARTILPRRFDPIDQIVSIAPIPLLILHSKEDEVIPYAQGQALFERAGEPKQWLQTDGSHIASFKRKTIQKFVLSFIQHHI